MQLLPFYATEKKKEKEKKGRNKRKNDRNLLVHEIHLP